MATTSRVISWEALVRAADEDFDKEERQPVQYEFGKRKFRRPRDPYAED